MIQLKEIYVTVELLLCYSYDTDTTDKMSK